MASTEVLERYGSKRMESNELLTELTRLHGFHLRELADRMQMGPARREKPLTKASAGHFLPDISTQVRAGKSEDAMKTIALVPQTGLDEQRRLLDRLSEVRKELGDMRRQHTGITTEFARQQRDRLSVGMELFRLRQLRKQYQDGLTNLGAAIGTIEVPAVRRSALYERHNRRYNASIEAIDGRIDELEKTHGKTAIQQEIKYQALKDREDLSRTGHLDTAIQDELEEQYRTALNSNRHLFVWGHTGTGKTTGVVRMFRKMDIEPIIFPCGGETTQSDLFATARGTMKKGKKGGMVARIGPVPAGISKAILEDRPIIMDEGNALRPDVLTAILPVLDALEQKRTTVDIPELGGKSLRIGKNFRIVFTGNPKGEGYLGREELDNAMSRRASNHTVEYPPVEDLKRVVMAELIDPVTLGYPKEALKKCSDLANAIHLIQTIYSGHKTDYYGPDSDQATGKHSNLTKATAAVNDLRTIINGWRSRNFEGTPDKEILDYIKQVNAPNDEKRLLTHIFIPYGFLRTVPHQKVPWLRPETWREWLGQNK